MSLLVVDDEELVRTGTAEMLRELGHRVSEASSGGDALAKLNAGMEIDALVTDYMMPGRGKLELGLPQLAKPFRQSDLAAALQQLREVTNVVALPQRAR